jgi:CAAX prenyl protease-like protein
LPGRTLLPELYLQHLEKFLGFFLALAGGLQGKRIFLLHEPMKPASRVPHRRKLIAYTLPMALFLAFLALGSALKTLGASFALSAPEYWLYPTQTFLCGALLIWFRRDYEFGKFRQPLFVIAIGTLIFLLWISPQQFFGFAPRVTGFDPTTFAARPTAYWFTVILRFLRLVVVVPLVEEIFWRGFLLRYLIDERFDAVPFGKFSWFSFCCVSVAFALAHSTADWPVALITGVAYNAIAYRTKSLTSCVLVHAMTNLLLGLWIMCTQQWGFW